MNVSEGITLDQLTVRLLRHADDIAAFENNVETIKIERKFTVNETKTEYLIRLDRNHANRIQKACVRKSVVI